MVLSLSIAIQLSLFFIVASIGLWIDQLYNGDIGKLASAASIYKGVLITVLIVRVSYSTSYRCSILPSFVAFVPMVSSGELLIFKVHKLHTYSFKGLDWCSSRNEGSNPYFPWHVGWLFGGLGCDVCFHYLPLDFHRMAILHGYCLCFLAVDRCHIGPGFRLSVELWKRSPSIL